VKNDSSTFPLQRRMRFKLDENLVERTIRITCLVTLDWVFADVTRFSPQRRQCCSDRMASVSGQHGGWLVLCAALPETQP